MKMKETKLRNRIIQGHALEVLRELPEASVDCVITSPPYWSLRKYDIKDIVWPDGWCGQLGLEPDMQLYLSHLLIIFDEVKRVLKDTGTLWVNISDTYSGGGGSTNSGFNERWGGKPGRRKQEIEKPHIKSTLPAKSLCGIPERFVIAMTDRGWVRRNTVVWHKPNCMPSSAKDRFTVDFEPVYFFTKQGKYYFEQQFEPHQTQNLEYEMNKSSKWGNKKAQTNKPNVENYRKDTRAYYPQGRNKRCVWTIPTQPFSEAAHFAVFPEKLVEPMIRAGCPEDGLVLDPFAGTGTVAVVAQQLRRNYLMIEASPKYIEMAERRLKKPENAQVRLL